MNVLAFEEVALTIGGVRLFDALSFAVEAGERVAIIGDSGLGKSLILRLALGLTAPSRGAVRLFDDDVATLDPARLRRARLRCGVVLQGGSLMHDLSIEANLRLGLGEAGRAARFQRRLDRLLVDFDIAHVAARDAGAVSTGEQRRAELARAFVRDPELVLLDEPLDRINRDDDAIVALIERQVVGHGRAMLLVTQSAPLARRLAQRCFLLTRAGLVQQAVDDRAPAAAS